MLTYARFVITVGLVYPLFLLSLLLGGPGIFLAALLVYLAYPLIDTLTSFDTSSYASRRGPILDTLLYLHLPWAVLTLLLMLWQAVPGDLFGIGRLLSSRLGDWVLEAHGRYTHPQLLACAFAAGLMLSTNTIVGHEFVHRRADRPAVLAGRWLLAMNGDAQFSISHVYGHHVNVGTSADPATARRGESLYAFAVRSAIGQYREANAIVRKRLEGAGLPYRSLHNELLTGIAMSVAVAAVCYALAGWTGVAMFLISALTAKFLFENVNYIQHYGLVRVAGSRVEDRHSWDCATRTSTWAFYSLTRHAHHHRRASAPFWELMPSGMVEGRLHWRYGYVVTMLLAMVPPLWVRITTPLLLEWDRQAAAPPERELAAAANRESGIPALAAARLGEVKP